MRVEMVKHEKKVVVFTVNKHGQRISSMVELCSSSSFTMRAFPWFVLELTCGIFLPNYSESVPGLISCAILLVKVHLKDRILPKTFRFVTKGGPIETKIEETTVQHKLLHKLWNPFTFAKSAYICGIQNNYIYSLVSENL